MTTKVISVTENETIKNLFKIFDKNGILGVPVVNDKNEVTGIITESDLIKHFTTLEAPNSINLLGGIVYLENIGDFNKHLKEHCAETVKDMAFNTAVTVDEDKTLLDVINIMADEKITRLPVVNADNKLTGIITRTDVVHQIAKMTKI